MGIADPIVLNLPVNAHAVKSNKIQFISSVTELTSTKQGVFTPDSSQAERETIAITGIR